jgi:catechol 2,3-dioxygenase-like lactoylglutathione lyase family enzyme
MTASEPLPIDRAALDARRDAIRSRHLHDAATRPPSTARGIHHEALISGDVERTVRFWQDVLGFPLVDMFENRDLEGSTHFFFDVGNGNLIGFFDLPSVGPAPYAEVLGGHHHLSISMTHDEWLRARSRLDAAGVECHLDSGTSVYFRGPDGERLELIADPLGEMYGHVILEGRAGERH